MTVFAWQAADPAASVGELTAEWTAYVRVFFILAGVLVLAYAALRWWLPKFGGRLPASRGLIEVLDKRSLEPRRHLYLLKACSQYVLIASSETGLQFLTELDPVGVETKLQAVPLKQEPPS
jgi:flagellar biogenesis protein FliO